MNERDEIIELLEHVEACLEDAGTSLLLDLQTKVREARERLMKKGLSFVYCLDDDTLFDWNEKAGEEHKALKLFILTAEIEIMARNGCDAQMNAKEMVDGYLDNRARLSLILKLREASDTETGDGGRVL